MTKLVIVLTFVFLFATAGCLPTGDAGGRLRGEIIVDEGTSMPCELILFLERGNLKVGSAFVDGVFEEEFVLSPTADNYYVTIACPGAGSEFRSATIKMGSLDDYRLGIDLGLIDFRLLSTAPN